MQDIPYGYCHCGCGEKTTVSPQTAKMFGWTAGEPRAYVRGHGRRKRLDEYHVVRDCGYETPCWIFQGCIRSDGYGIFQRDSKIQRAHRYYYEQHIGAIPDGLTLDHLCRNRSCVNPEHLEPVTRGENVRRGARVRPLQTHCKRGHEFTPANTRVGTSGSRFCRACDRLRDRAKRAKGVEPKPDSLSST